MIFNSNTTLLGASTIPMAEGYDCSYGVSLALVESARNDLAVFKAMVEADYKEISICRESTGYVQESELQSLHEAVGGGIFKKIADLFKKLVAKIKSIFHSFFAKINGLWMKDRELIKKYEKEISKKRNIGNLEVKWRKPADGVNISDPFDGKTGFGAAVTFKDAEGWDEETSKRVEYYFGEIDSKYSNIDNRSEFIEEFIDNTLEDESTEQIKDIGGIFNIIKAFTGMDKSLNKLKRNVDKVNSEIEKEIKKYDKASTNAYKAVKDAEEKDKKSKETELETANKTYDMALAYQEVMLAYTQAVINVGNIWYKQHKAAFVKAAAANDKKLEESAVLLDAIAEAAEYEVDAAINLALSDEEISKLSSANTSVLDSDVSNDPDKLTYGPDKYTDSASFSRASGSIDSRIGGGKVEESYFGKLFY